MPKVDFSLMMTLNDLRRTTITVDQIAECVYGLHAPPSDQINNSAAIKISDEAFATTNNLNKTQ